MRIALFSAALLASIQAAAATPIDGMYGSIFGGYSNLSNHINSETFLRRFNSPFNNNFNTFNHYGIPGNFERTVPRNGYNGGARLGFQSNVMRYEGEFTYVGAVNKSSYSTHERYPFHLNYFNPFANHVPKRKSETNALFGMANVYYDFPATIPCISPFVGVGLGYGWVQTRLDFENPLFPNSFSYPQNAYFSNDFSTSDSAFSYQATAGLTFNYLENWALNLAYRYIGTTKLKNFGRGFQANLLSVGLVYRFNEYNYK
ncbi:MAG: porin family protein [Tatlockia sp.]|nr:porin family protein [Tatlockia sp.]